MNALPEMPPEVSSDTVLDFLEQVAIDSEINPQGEWEDVTRPVTIVGRRGRHLRVRRKNGNTFPSWHELSDRLIGNGFPCELFSITESGFLLTATLKTIDQLAADEAACELDTRGGGSLIVHRRPLWPGADEEAGPKTVRERRAGKRKDKRKLTGANAFVLKVMQEDAPTGAIDIETLVERTISQMPIKKDVRGLDRREGYVRSAIPRLVAGGYLHVHGDDQESVRLHRVKEVDD